MTDDRKHTPTCVLQVELSQPLPPLLPAETSGGERFRRAKLLVRLHTCPLGEVDLDLGAEGLAPADYAPHIWRCLHREIGAHLLQDGLPPIATLGVEGISSPVSPACISAREQRLASDPPLVSVIVATRDRPEALAVCLERLLALDYPNYEILVVDNAPATDITAALVAEQFGAVAHLRYLREDRPGISWARDCGIRQAQGSLVALTDDDVVVDSHWLTSLVGGFAAAEEAACVCGLVLPAELETQAQIWFEQFASFGRGYTRQVYDLHENRRDTLFYPYTGLPAIGANMAVRKSVYLELGGFAPQLGVGTPTCGGEDLDFCFRVVAQGHQLVYEPSALMFHYHRRDYTRLRRQVYGYGLGFTAYLLHCLWVKPARIPRFAAIVPYGLYLLLKPQSAHNAQKRQDYPQDLRWQEWKGMLMGPLAYLRSRWQSRRMSRPGRRTPQSGRAGRLAAELNGRPERM